MNCGEKNYVEGIYVWLR